MRTIMARLTSTLALLLTACWPALATDGTLTGAGDLELAGSDTGTFSLNVQQTGASISGTVSFLFTLGGGSRSQVDIQITSGDIAGDMFGTARQTIPSGGVFTYPDTRLSYSISGGSYDLGVLGYQNSSIGSSFSIKSGGIMLTLTPSYSISLLYDPSRSVKSGAAYPIRIQVLNASGENVSSASLAVTAQGIVQKDGVPDGPLEDTGNANPSYGFRYDASLGGYVYNVDTRGLSSGTYIVPFTAGSNSQLYEASFNVK